jgi:thiol-disulfide isomerase/thioredoxin
VLVEFMTTTCIYCKNAIAGLNDLQSRYGAAGLQVIAVACDNMPQRQRAVAAAQYAKDNNVNYALYVEPGADAGGVRDRYAVEEYPTVVLLDANGKVLWKGHPNKRLELEAAVKQALGK